MSRALIARPAGYTPPRNLKRKASATPPLLPPAASLQAPPSLEGVRSSGEVQYQPTSRVRASMHVNPELKAELLLEQILALPNTVRKQLLDKVQLAVMTDAAANDKDRDLAMWSEAVYQRFVSGEQGSTSGGAGPLHFRKLLAVGTAWAPVQDFMHAARLHELPVVERAAAYHLLADILVDHVKGIAAHTGGALSPKMVANCAHLLRGAFESNFPGYIAAGLVKVVVAQMRRAA